ncbi:MAG: hypothetical protein ACRYG8_41015, partial [Janthinobacterium lividum]
RRCPDEPGIVGHACQEAVLQPNEAPSSRTDGVPGAFLLSISVETLSMVRSKLASERGRAEAPPARHG